MKVIKQESNGRDHYFWVKFADKRVAFLHVDKFSSPVHVVAGDVSGCLTIEDRHASLDEAATFLISEVNENRVRFDS